jgi:hypothetical protein
MHWGGILGLAGAVRHRIALPTDLCCGALKAERIAENLEQRNDPGLARKRHEARLREFASPFEKLPSLPDVREGGLDFAAEPGSIEAE